MIKYKYSKDKNQQIVCIESVNKQNRDASNFYCIGCDNELVARIGEVNVRHFAHKNTCLCNKETYLHSLSKYLFYNEYRSCVKNQDPFYVEVKRRQICNSCSDMFNIECVLGYEADKIDLIRYFDQIHVEKKEGGFVADILLSSSKSDNKMFVEFAVTHKSSKSKLQSGYKIIEIVVTDESDLSPVLNRCIDLKSKHVSFINFYTKEIKARLCNPNECCENGPLNVSVLYKDGRCLIVNSIDQVFNALGYKHAGIVGYIATTTSTHHGVFYKSSVSAFAKNRAKIKNCFICRYHAINSHFQYLHDQQYPIFCKFLKDNFKSTRAISCKYFKMEKEYVNEDYRISLNVQTQ